MYLIVKKLQESNLIYQALPVFINTRSLEFDVDLKGIEVCYGMEMIVGICNALVV